MWPRHGPLAWAIALVVLCWGCGGSGPAASRPTGEPSPTVEVAPAPATAAAAAPAPPSAPAVLEATTRFRAVPSSADDPPNYVSHLAYGPDGSQLWVGSSDGDVVLCDGRRGAVVRHLATLPRSVSSLELSADGRELLTVAGGEARLWALPDGREQQRLEVGVLSALHFVPDGRHFAECDPTRVVRFLDRRTGQTTRRYGQAEPGDDRRQNLMAPTSLAFSPDGSRMATARWDQPVMLWDVPSGARRGTLDGRLTVRWSPDGRTIAAATGTIAKRVGRTSLRLRLFDAAGGHRLRTLDEPAPHSARFAPSSRWIAAVGDGTVRLWSVATGALVARGRHADHRPIEAAFAPDGTTLATGGRDGDVVLWQIREPRRAR